MEIHVLVFGTTAISSNFGDYFHLVIFNCSNYEVDNHVPSVIFNFVLQGILRTIRKYIQNKSENTTVVFIICVVVLVIYQYYLYMP